MSTPEQARRASARTAAAIRAALRRRHADLLPLTELATLTGADPAALRKAAFHHPDLGVCGPASAPLLWMLPPEPLANGFQPDYRNQRLALLLPGDRPLLLIGHEPAPTPTAAPGPGPLNHAIHRHVALASRWMILPEAHRGTAHHTHRLFQLAARTWRASSVPRWRAGPLTVHRTRHPTPVAIGADGTLTHSLDLVTIARHGPQMINIHPTGSPPERRR